MGLQYLALGDGFSFLALVCLAFKGWMIMDAIRSGNDRMWYIILFVPFGEWIYFFMFKAHDPHVRRYLKRILPQRKANLEMLKREAVNSPSVRNRQLLADGLFDAGKFDEALGAYEGILKSSAENRSILYRVAQCHHKLAELDKAQTILQEIVKHDRKFQDYQAVLELAEIAQERGDARQALTLLRELNTISSRLDLRLALVRATLESTGTPNGDPIPASNDHVCVLLDEIIHDFRSSPAFYRRENGRIFREARRLRRGLGAISASAH